MRRTGYQRLLPQRRCGRCSFAQEHRHDVKLQRGAWASSRRAIGGGSGTTRFKHQPSESKESEDAAGPGRAGLLLGCTSKEVMASDGLTVGNEEGPFPRISGVLWANAACSSATRP